MRKIPVADRLALDGTERECETERGYGGRERERDVEREKTEGKEVKFDKQ